MSSSVDKAEEEPGNGGAVRGRPKTLTSSMSADELILQRRQMSAKRKVIRLQRELHEANLNNMMDHKTSKARERAAMVRESSNRLQLHKEAMRMQEQFQHQQYAKELYDSTRESKQRIAAQRAAAARKNAHGIRSRVSPLKLKEPLVTFFNEPSADVDPSTLPRLELAALMRGREAVSKVQEQKRQGVLDRRRWLVEAEQFIEDEKQRDNETKLRIAQRITAANKQALQKAADEVSAKKKADRQAVRDRNDQIELKRLLLKNAVKATEEQVVSLAEACNHRLRDIAVEEDMRLPWAPWFRFFKAVDTDGSGLISFDEFSNLVRVELGLQAEQGLDEPTVRAVWVTVDADSSGYITCGEFAQFMRKGSHVLTKHVRSRDQQLEARAKAAREARQADKEHLFHGRSLSELEGAQPATDEEMRRMSEVINGRILTMREAPFSPSEPSSPDGSGASPAAHFPNKPTQQGRWYALYKLADENSNGYISFTELRTMIQRDLALPPSLIDESRLRATWKALDHDGDGLVTCGEFMQWMKTGAPKEKSASALDVRRQHGRRQRAKVEEEREALHRAKLEELDGNAKAMQKRARQLELELAQRRQQQGGGA